MGNKFIADGLNEGEMFLKSKVNAWVARLNNSSGTHYCRQL